MTFCCTAATRVLRYNLTIVRDFQDRSMAASTNDTNETKENGVADEKRDGDTNNDFGVNTTAAQVRSPR